MKAFAAADKIKSSLENITKAIAIITEILPFDKRNYILTVEKELIRYLILALPFSYGTIDLVITSMLYRFQKNIQFLVNFQQGLETIASFSDTLELKGDTATMKIGKNDRLLQEMKSISSGAGLDSVMRKLNEEYSPIVRENVINLKKAALVYAGKLYDIFNALATTNSFDQASSPVLRELIHPINLCKIFVEFTKDSEILQMVLDLLGKNFQAFFIEVDDIKTIKSSKTDIFFVGFAPGKHSPLILRNFSLFWYFILRESVAIWKQKSSGKEDNCLRLLLRAWGSTR